MLNRDGKSGFVCVLITRSYKNKFKKGKMLIQSLLKIQNFIVRSNLYPIK